MSTPTATVCPHCHCDFEPQYLGAVVITGSTLWIRADHGAHPWLSVGQGWGSWDGLLARDVRYLTASERTDLGMPALADGMSIEVPDSIKDVRATLRLAQVAVEDSPEHIFDWAKHVARLRALIAECDRIIAAQETR